MTIDPHSVTLFSHPIITIKTLVLVLLELSLKAFKILQNKIILLCLAVSIGVLILVPFIRQIAWFISFWLLTGIASSIGLGTGLHTFVLYLLPHVAAVMTASLKCNGIVPQMLPSRYNFEYFG
jgi:ABC-type methionine transport system permease subunit